MIPRAVGDRAWKPNIYTPPPAGFLFDEVMLGEDEAADGILSDGYLWADNWGDAVSSRRALSDNPMPLYNFPKSARSIRAEADRAEADRADKIRYDIREEQDRNWADFKKSNTEKKLRKLWSDCTARNLEIMQSYVASVEMDMERAEERGDALLIPIFKRNIEAASEHCNILLSSVYPNFPHYEATGGCRTPVLYNVTWQIEMGA